MAQTAEQEAEGYVREALRALGFDMQSEGMRGTPGRWVRALQDMTANRDRGDTDAARLLRVDFDGGCYDEVVAVAGMPFTSLCEHHLLPVIGRASIAYLPSEDAQGRSRVVGLSKLPRLVELYARRPQLQERMTVQIGDALEKHLCPRATGVLIEASHACMSCRGVRSAGVMRTEYLRGTFRDLPHARAEAMERMRMP